MVALYKPFAADWSKHDIQAARSSINSGSPRSSLCNDGGGMIMTLSVSPNSNGTITITCDNDSVTIGAPAAPKLDGSAETPILWPNSGATASIVAGGKAKTKVIRVPSGDDLLTAIREQ